MAKLKSYGCTNIERIQYEYQPPPTQNRRNQANADPSVEPGGSRRRGYRIVDSVNNDPMKPPDERLRDMNSQPSTPGPREEVYCTKIGTVHPEEMYVVAAHVEGQGWGEAANDNGSGMVLVMNWRASLVVPM